MLGNSCWLPRFFRYSVLLFSENKRGRASIYRCHFVPLVNCAQVIWLRPFLGSTKMFCLKAESSPKNQAGVRAQWSSGELPFLTSPEQGVSQVLIDPSSVWLLEIISSSDRSNFGKSQTDQQWNKKPQNSKSNLACTFSNSSLSFQKCLPLRAFAITSH